MGGVSHQLDCLKMSVEQRLRTAHDIDEADLTAGFEDTPDFAERQRNIVPVVRAVSTDNAIEAGVGKRQPIDGSVQGGDVGHVALAGGRGYDVQHGWREIVGEYVPGEGSDGETGVSGSAAEIENLGMRNSCDGFREPSQIFSL